MFGMLWPTWQQAGVAAAVSAVLCVVLRRVGARWAAYAAPFAFEFALIAVLYGIWRLARMLPLASTNGALSRAHDIASFQAFLHFPSELSLQHLVLRHEWLADAASWYYADVHVPALGAFLVWLFVRHRDRYPHWRNALVLVTAGCLIIRFVRVAPPRFLPDLGYVDLATRVGYSIYPQDVSRGVSDQFAAMPSIHVAWAAVVSFGIVTVSTSRWRWLFLPHVVMTMLVVAATGNHWWLDGIVAVALLAVGLSLDSAVRLRHGQAGRQQADAAPPAGADETSPATAVA
jgi:hypothetical protein